MIVARTHACDFAQRQRKATPNSPLLRTLNDTRHAALLNPLNRLSHYYAVRARLFILLSSSLFMKSMPKKRHKNDFNSKTADDLQFYIDSVPRFFSCRRSCLERSRRRLFFTCFLQAPEVSSAVFYGGQFNGLLWPFW